MPRTIARVPHLSSALPPDLLSVLTLVDSTYRANLNLRNHEDFFLCSPCSVNLEIHAILLSTMREAQCLVFAAKHLTVGNCSECRGYDSGLANEKDDSPRRTFDICLDISVPALSFRPSASSPWSARRRVLPSGYLTTAVRPDIGPVGRRRSPREGWRAVPRGRDFGVQL